MTIILLLFSGGLIYTAQTKQRQYKAALPDANLCSYTIPSVYENQIPPKSPTYTLRYLPSATTQFCASGEHYILFNEIKTNESVPERAGYTRCVDPCVSPVDKTECHTLPCFRPELETEDDQCTSYRRNDILYCMCQPALRRYVRTSGFFTGTRKFWNDYTPCQDFLADYTIKNFFIFAAAVSVVVINLALKGVLKYLAKFERHHSVSSMASATAVKLFFASFLNTAIIVLIINAKMPDTGVLAKFSWLFRGEYEDFKREWYGIVGVGIVSTMIVNVIVPQLAPLLQTYVLYPLKRRHKIKAAVTQEQMNKLYEGPPFDISLRFPLVLNTLFVTLFYCGGLPILLPIAAVACFANYMFDKLTIIRLYSVKTTYDEALGKTALGLLPWALFFHLCFSTWMYGNREILETELISSGWATTQLGTGSSGARDAYQALLKRAEQYDPFKEYGLIPKITRVNVIPMFAFLAFFIISSILLKVAGNIIYPIIDKTIGRIFRGVLGVANSIAIKPDETAFTTIPPYTGEFKILVPPNHNVRPDDLLAGWRSSEGTLYRIWTKETETRGITRKPNQRRLTWEALQAPLTSYAIEDNETYTHAAHQIAELYRTRSTRKSVVGRQAKLISSLSSNSNASTSKVIPTLD